MRLLRIGFRTARSQLMKITVQQLRYLLKAAEIGSISNAAKELSIAHGTISEAISQVEKELGFEVFTRSKQGITPTEKGIEALAYARRVTESMNAFENHYSSHSSRIGRFAVSTQEFKFVIAAYNQVTNTLDPCRYEFAVNLRQFFKPADDVYAGISDIGVMFVMKENEQLLYDRLEEKGLEFHPLFKANFWAYLDRNHPLGDREAVSLKELSAYPEFSFENFRHMKMTGRSQLTTPSNLRGRNTIAPDDLAHPDLISQIAEIDGFALWINLFPNHAPYERTVIIPLKEEKWMKIGYVIQKGRELNEVEQRFVDLMKTYDPALRN